MAAPETIQPLVDRYTYHRDAYLRGQEKYNETQIEAVDASNDMLMYELYRRMEEDIGIEEGGH